MTNQAALPVTARISRSFQSIQMSFAFKSFSGPRMVLLGLHNQMQNPAPIALLNELTANDPCCLELSRNWWHNRLNANELYELRFTRLHVD